jgi:4-carboxymuconolactone decarboxylase
MVDRDRGSHFQNIKYLNRTRHLSYIEPLARLAAALTSSEEEPVVGAIHMALDRRIPTSMLREVILTAYLFDGYPAALEGFRILNRLTGGETLPPHSTISYTPGSVEEWRSRGERFCRAVYGPQFGKLSEHVAEIAPELADSMIVEGYGKVLSRNELEPKLRELVVVAILAAKYRPRQLLSHCLGALRLGASENELRKAFDAAGEVIPEETMAKSTVILEDAIGRFVKS